VAIGSGLQDPIVSPVMAAQPQPVVRAQCAGALAAATPGVATGRAGALTEVRIRFW